MFDIKSSFFKLMIKDENSKDLQIMESYTSDKDEHKNAITFGSYCFIFILSSPFSTTHFLLVVDTFR